MDNVYLNMTLWGDNHGGERIIEPMDKQYIYDLHNSCRVQSIQIFSGEQDNLVFEIEGLKLHDEVTPTEEIGHFTLTFKNATIKQTTPKTLLPYEGDFKIDDFNPYFDKEKGQTCFEWTGEDITLQEVYPTIYFWADSLEFAES